MRKEIQNERNTGHKRQNRKKQHRDKLFLINSEFHLSSPFFYFSRQIGFYNTVFLQGVRTIFLGPLTEGAVEQMRDWGSLTFNTPSVGYADTSLTREARVLCGFGGELVGVGVLDDPCRIFSPSVTCGDTSLVRGRQNGYRNLAATL